MRLKILLTIIISFLLVLPIAYSAGSQSEDSFYSFDFIDGVDANNNEQYGDNGTSPILIHADGPGGNNGLLNQRTAKLGAFAMDRTTDFDAPVFLDNTFIIADTVSWSMWIILDSVGAQVIGELRNLTGVGSQLSTIRWDITAANNITASVEGKITSNSGVTAGAYFHYAGTVSEGSVMTTWLNGTEVIGSQIIDSLAGLIKTRRFGKDGIGGTLLDGGIDDLRIWYNFTLSQTDVDTLFNNGDGTQLSLNVSLIDTTSPTVTIISPDNNSIQGMLPVNITLSVTDNQAGNIVCDLRNNTNFYDLINTSQATNFNLTLNLTGSISITDIYNINCTDLAGNSQIEVLGLTIDTLNPVITIINPLNNSDHITNIQVNLSCVNINLVNLSYVFFNSSNIIQEEFNATISVTESIIKTPINITNLALGSYNFNVSCLDNATNTANKFLLLNIVAIPIPTITAETVLPLETASNIVAMIFLFVITAGLFLKMMSNKK